MEGKIDGEKKCAAKKKPLNYEVNPTKTANLRSIYSKLMQYFRCIQFECFFFLKIKRKTKIDWFW